MPLYPALCSSARLSAQAESLERRPPEEKTSLSLPSAAESPVPARDGDGSFADTLSARAFLRARGPSPKEREALP